MAPFNAPLWWEQLASLDALLKAREQIGADSDNGSPLIFQLNCSLSQVEF